MNVSKFGLMAALFMLYLMTGCASTGGVRIPVDTASSLPGGSVTLRGEKQRLVGTPLQVGSPLPSTVLINAFTMKRVDLAGMKGHVLFLSVVPSIDTKVCEVQTHYLGEQGSRLSPGIVRIVVSRDTPFAQKRFAEEAKLGGLTFLSDYRDGSFGRATGLLVEESMLLARSIILVDREGIVRYIQVVPELSHLPDMETAFARAESMLTEK
jgi:thioredoxin-dependent peroxiredoxin